MSIRLSSRGKLDLDYWVVEGKAAGLHKEKMHHPKRGNLPYFEPPPKGDLEKEPPISKALRSVPSEDISDDQR
jgi:hypothetical protein